MMQNVADVLPDQVDTAEQGDAARSQDHARARGHKGHK